MANKLHLMQQYKSIKYLMFLVGVVLILLSLVTFSQNGLGRYTLLGGGLGLTFIGFGLSPKYLAQNLFSGNESLKGASSVLVLLGGLAICTGEVLHFVF